MLKQIKASAGSGKTYTLTRDFLTLLKDSKEKQGALCRLYKKNTYEPQRVNIQASLFDETLSYAWSDILAVTFTNKAASEMKERILHTLKTFALMTDQEVNVLAAKKGEFSLSTKQAKNWLKNILSSYAALNIRTIDSLLTQLARLSALDLSLPPDFQPAFSPKDYFNPVYDALVLRIAQGDEELISLFQEAIKSLLFHTNSNGFILRKAFIDRLLSLIELGFVKMPFIRDEFDDNNYFSRFLTVSPEDIKIRLKAKHNDFNLTAQILLENISLAKITLDKRALTALENAKNHIDLSFPKHSSYYEKESLEPLIVKKDHDNISNALESNYGAFKTAYLELTQKGTLYKLILEYLPFIKLAKPVFSELCILQELHGKIPTERIYSGAGEVLNNDAGVSTALCRLGANLAHVLIDEFQDTSRTQWRAIAPLAEECISRGGTLTYVGDVKQAIYGWRGGEASLFEEVPEYNNLKQKVTKFNKEVLPCNWRSSRAVIEFNNHFFNTLADYQKALAVAEVMLPKETPAEYIQLCAETLQRAFIGVEQSLPQRDAQDQTHPSGLVSLSVVEGTSKAELDEATHIRLKQTLADIIQRRGQEGIAVLVRKNSQASQVAAWLSEFGLPVVTNASFLLSENVLIQELIAFLKFLDNPKDEIAFWTIISSQTLFLSYANLKSEVIFSWLATLKAKKNSNIILAFQNDFPDLWLKVFKPFLNSAAFMNAYDCVAELSRCFNLTKNQRNQEAYLSRFLELLYSGAEQGFSSICDFLAYWNEVSETIHLPAPEDPSAIRILTIHNSKGLEFPVLIIPYHDFSDRADSLSKKLVEYELDGEEFLVPCKKETSELWFKEKVKGVCENLNLLYVAWTRAAEESHLFINRTLKKTKAESLEEDTEKPSESSTMRGIEKILELNKLELGNDESLSFVSNFENQAYKSLNDADSSELDSLQDAEKLLANSTLTTCGFDKNTSQLDDASSSSNALHQLEAFTPMQWLPRLKIFRNQLEEFNFTPKRRGMLVHACLEHLYLTGDDNYDAETAVHLGMSNFPLPVPDPQAIFIEIKDLLLWLIKQPELAFWLNYGSSEQSILDEEAKLHRVDLLVDDGKSISVVEYKTGGKEDKHTQQVKRYLNLLSKAYNQDYEIKAYLVYLDAKEIEEVCL